MQYSRLCHFLEDSHVTLSYSLYRQVIFIVKHFRMNQLFWDKLTDFNSKNDELWLKNDQFRSNNDRFRLKNIQFRLKHDRFHKSWNFKWKIHIGILFIWSYISCGSHCSHNSWTQDRVVMRSFGSDARSKNA